MCSSTPGRNSPYATQVMKMKKEELAAGIKDADLLLKRLVDYGIFTSEQKLALSHYETHLEKVNRILDILISQGEHACQVFFYPCLKQLEPNLYQIIRKYTMGTDEIMYRTRQQSVGHFLDGNKNGLEKSAEKIQKKHNTMIQAASVKPKLVSYLAAKTKGYPASQTPRNSPTSPIHALNASGKGDVDVENGLENRHGCKVMSPRENPLGAAVAKSLDEIHNYSMIKSFKAEGKDGKEKSLLQRAAERARGDAEKVLQGGMSGNNLDSRVPMGFHVQGGKHTVMRLMLERNPGNPYYLQYRPALQAEDQGVQVCLEDDNLLNAMDKADTASTFPGTNSLEEAIKILLTTGINADSGILHNAFHHDDQVVIQLLLKHSSILPSETKEQALFEGIRKNLPRVVTALVDVGTNLNARDHNQYTPLLLAAEMDRAACANVLIRRGANMAARTAHLDSALHLAVKAGAVYTVELLLDNGMSPNLAGWNGQTSLHTAAWYNKHEMVNILINAGANINALTTEQNTPLHITSERGHVDTAIQLIQQAADLNMKNKLSMTPLHLAARAGNMTMVELLLHSGADPNVPDREKKTALHWAASASFIKVVKYLLNYKARSGTRDMDGYSPLHYAALKGNVELVKIFLEAGKNKNINERNIYRKTPLHLAVEQGHTELIKMLINNGAAVNALDNNRDTPLHCACKTGHWGSVTSLINCSQREKPDLQASNSLGKTPLQVAEGSATQSQEQIVTLLRKKMFLTR
ncbi:CARD- and ANK-domain containing inflammasome adapter protein-like [Monodelphis domestica]|uniref:CARD- and ANK-domain containing inflammasome adapter protein-like n=1 Tax=Monodelphis domestica TaxID=13616 RepID=UPI0000D9152A|nr:CARD- and ANK-domain containing inflammasome adapter protein-like [Monodelphis domestica]XP_056671030.1 CARD- and ANK-domain containing inflammasome adapter protein-like [Monodelphis domestica]